MDPNKQFDDLFQQMKKVDRSPKDRQESLAKLRARVQKKKKFHLAPAFISFAMLLIAALLFMTLNTEVPGHEGQSGVNKPSEIEQRTIHYVLSQEFNGPNKQFIKLKTNPATISDEEAIPSNDGLETIYLYEFLENTYGPYFTESGFENFVPYAYFYHLGEESSSYQFTLGKVDIEKSKEAPSQYELKFEVNFTNSIGVSQNFPMTGIAEFAENGKLQDIEFEDPEGLSVTILENI